jgi:hypothetical protein
LFLTDLLTEAASPSPRFAVVVCEDIERSARDTFNALRLEKELSRNGIPLFATDEPADIAGVNATTVLVRRVKQGVAEWYRLQLKERAWKGWTEHNAAGWNVGVPPYGYTAERHPHPNRVSGWLRAAYRPSLQAESDQADQRTLHPRWYLRPVWSAIRPWIPGRRTALSTDGHGRQDGSGAPAALAATEPLTSRFRK